MKRSIYLFLLLLCFIPPILSFRPPRRPDFHSECQRMNKTQPLNYLGTNLTLALEDGENLLLCPGDAIGDLNETYVKIGECNLTMYHQDKIIWSKGKRDYLRTESEYVSDEYGFCVFSLKRDGNLVLHQDEIRYSYYGGTAWSKMDGRETEFYPTKTELRVKGEQLQITRTFSDGSQRLFYLDENHQDFTEEMGKPIKKAENPLIKSHKDEDKTILRRNEYIGDLNGIHLILQPDCNLQLFNKNKTVWTFTTYFKHNELCTLDIAQDNTIQLSRKWLNKTLDGDRIMESPHPFEVVESRITFGDREPIIYQTLKNGSELGFYGGRLNRTLKQIAQKALVEQSAYDYYYTEHQYISRMERMEYLGNLTGLHLILEQNCSLILANGNERLWEFQSNSIDAVFSCYIQLRDGQIYLKKYPSRSQPMLERSYPTGHTELALDNDQIVVKKKCEDQDLIFYAGRDTNGSFFQFIAQNSVIIAHNNNYEIEILPKMGYIGDLNGIYVLLDQNCNLVLYNKTQILWESGTSLDHTSEYCILGLHPDMKIKISGWVDDQVFWSAMDFKPNPNFGRLLKAELSIINDELWLIYTFQDGTVKTEKAMRGTNHFTNNLVQFQPPPHTDEEKTTFCSKRNATHRGANLTSNNNDLEDIVLCLGDTFGDLNETYVTLECCSLAMYHKEKRVWSSNKYSLFPWIGKCACAFSLGRDGNLVVYDELVAPPYLGKTDPVPHRVWDSKTNFYPVKSELRLEDQQIQLVQTFGDGTQRLFYADENHECIGPRKRADKFFLKKHSDEDKTILRRNEYIGDLNGTYLILQPNCQLQLLNKSKIVWSFIPPFRHQINCTLNVAQDNTIEISRGLADEPHDRESLIKHQKPRIILESKITFEGDQPIIIQTLDNKDKFTFCGIPGQNSGLIPKRNLTQIAPGTLILTNNDVLLINRMDYIGNLTGLHLLLEQNCSLILANGNQKLWELQNEPYPTNDPLMECSVKLEPNGEIYMERNFLIESQKRQPLIGYERDRTDITEVRLTLENDQIIVKKERSEGRPDIFYAGPTTNGSFFKFLAESSITINLDDRSEKRLLSKMEFIGDLNGVFTVLDKKCNWILYNKTQVLWESGTYVESGRCSLSQSNKGELGVRGSLWSAFGSSVHKGFLLNKPISAEVLVNNAGLWLIYTLKDGATHQYKAITGTNQFGLVSKGYGKSFGLEL